MGRPYIGAYRVVVLKDSDAAVVTVDVTARLDVFGGEADDLAVSANGITGTEVVESDFVAGGDQPWDDYDSGGCLYMQSRGKGPQGNGN